MVTDSIRVLLLEESRTHNETARLFDSRVTARLFAAGMNWDWKTGVVTFEFFFVTRIIAVFRVVFLISFIRREKRATTLSII